MDDKNYDDLLDRVRDSYHVPPRIPREEMWSAVAGGIERQRAAAPDVVSLDAERRRRSVVRTPLAWAAAAAALVVFGVGIGRMTAPIAVEAPVAATDHRVAPEALELAAREHLGRTGSLLAMVRVDARGGGIEPGTAEWARDALAETRLLIDARRDGDPAVGELLEDLELLLAQVVQVAEMGSADPRASTELDLALKSLEAREVLPRLESVLPRTMAGA